MDCSPPGSSVPGILQARVLEWGAIAFSGDKFTSMQNTITQTNTKTNQWVYLRSHVVHLKGISTQHGPSATNIY